MNLKSIAVCTLVAALSTSCVGKFTGGGFIPGSADATKKATFGFNAHASDPDPITGIATNFKGQFQYRDNSTGLNIHVSITQALIADPDPITGFPTVRISGRTANGAFVSATVEDRGTPGVSAGDNLSIVVFDFVNGFIYFNNGTIGGGNVTYHAE